MAKMMVGSEGTLGVVLEADAESGAAAESQGSAGGAVRELLEALAATP